MKKPTKKKYPKKPKQSASVESKENFLKRIKEIDSEFKSALAKYESDKKKNKVLSAKIKAVRR